MVELSRRSFMTMAGGAAGAAALAMFGMKRRRTEGRVPVVQAADMKTQELSADVLVIGGGMAGLFAAVKAHDAGAKVLLISKGRIGSSGLTPFAKGIFAFDPKRSKMSLDAWVDAITRSCQGTNNPIFTRQLAEHSLARVEELRSWGFFDNVLYHKPFMAPLSDREIGVVERVMITHLIKEEGRIAGAAGFSIDEERLLFYQAKSVILCTGSGGFKPNGFPMCDVTHDGSVMAYEIGARVNGKEWNDGHPTNAKNPANSWGTWGDGAMFTSKPSTTSTEVRHDLGVDLNYRAYMLGGPVKMGPPGQQQDELKGGPYTPEEFARRPGPGGPGGGHDGPPGGGPHEGGGPPPGMGGVNVGGATAGMAIHKSEGLVPLSENCDTDIPGLYAAGDALGSCAVGGIYTQIGASLAGSAVQGAVAGAAAAAWCKGQRAAQISAAKRKQITTALLAPLKREQGYTPAYVTQTLQSVMIPNFVLYMKREAMLKGALAYIEELRDHHLPMLMAADLHELRLVFETANMVTVAEMKLRASLMRKESRASHFRLDYPEADEENWRAWINIYKGADGQMKLEKQPFGSWPAPRLALGRGAPPAFR